MSLHTSSRPSRSPAQDGGPAAPERTECLNCGAALAGPYCAACGQAARTGRLTFPRLARDALATLASFDSAALRTLRALSTRPGTFVREYLLGRRARYLGPLQYYVLVVALNVGAGALLDRPAANPARVEGGSFWEENLVALQIAVVFALIMLPLAAAQRWLHRGAGYSLAEHFAFTLFLLAQGVLVVIVVQLVLWPLGRGLQGDLDGAVWGAAFTAHLLWAGRDFFGEPAWRVALKVLGAYAAVLGFLAGIGVAAALVFEAG